MDMLVIILFVVIVLLIVTLRSKMLERMGQLEEEVKRLGRQLNRPPDTVPSSRPVTGTDAGTEQRGSPATEAPRKLETPPELEPYKIPQRKPVQYQSPPPSPISRPASSPGPEPVSYRVSGTGPTTSAGSTGGSRTPAPPPEPPSPGFFERHPDLEKFIGENLISKIGIAILVLAIGFFVKYAIDNDWVGPVGRVGIGLLCGGILVGVAHMLRNSYKAFSSVLVGGGLAVFYFTIALAYHQYHLFGQTASFVIMLVITLFAVILSMLYDRQELAIIALVGGFATPFMVSSGSGDYKILFSYLLILNTGLLAIAYNKAWRLLNALAFIFTALLFASWLFTLPETTTTGTFQGGFLFLTAFFILFLAINIANNIRENKKFIASDFGILLANTCLYFAAGLYLLHQQGLSKYDGMFSASMSVFNLVVSYFLFRKKKVDSNILYLLIGITLTFISLTAPIQLHGHYITLFWASESVLLYWFFQKSGIRIILLASRLVWIAMIVSLFMDWFGAYGNTFSYLPVIFNKGLMTTLYSAICCYILYFLRKKVAEGMGFTVAGSQTGTPAEAPASALATAEVGITVSRYADILIGSLLLFAGGALEIHHQFSFHYPDTNLFILYLLLYEFALVCLIEYAAKRWNWFHASSYAGWLLVASIAFYLMLLPDVFMIQHQLLESGRFRGHFIAHWASDLLVTLILYRLIAWVQILKIHVGQPAFAWIICAVVVIFLSAEVHLLMNALFFNKTWPLAEIQRIYIKTGLPILWGLCSFAFMWLGMRYKFKPLRIISLVLFTITLLKLFIFDISNIPVAGKIAAFFCLGVLLLIVSFMYQRLKKIIIEDGEKKIDQA
ncbi:MAG TPA: DUF2339 domain-containing protein [Puia sp.]|nr:DUF2339 domain-containing protein [Puia sp.]